MGVFFFEVEGAKVRAGFRMQGFLWILMMVAPCCLIQIDNSEMDAAPLYNGGTFIELNWDFDSDKKEPGSVPYEITAVAEHSLAFGCVCDYISEEPAPETSFQIPPLETGFGLGGCGGNRNTGFELSNA
ncbi:MAG: hypothetical protein U0V70_17460 [Terriglobia bacterium]